MILSATTLALGRLGPTLTSNDNGQFGYILQLGSQALLLQSVPVSISAARNTIGLQVVSQSTWGSGAMTISDGLEGVLVVAACLHTTSLHITGCIYAVEAGFDSHMVLTTPNITANAEGLYLESAQTDIRGGVVTGNTACDVAATFGTHAIFRGTTTVGTLTCDGSVIVRGSVTCPPASLGAPSRIATNTAAAVRQPVDPLPLIP
ncbi:MAG: hypothetical protein ACXW5U_05535 [Thermoanaerobaculia bacterium]